MNRLLFYLSRALTLYFGAKSIAVYAVYICCAGVRRRKIEEDKRKGWPKHIYYFTLLKDRHLRDIVRRIQSASHSNPNGGNHFKFI